MADAQVPPPTTTCTPGNPEFNSLRPYQASPCQTTTSPTAKFCGNTLTLQDTINETYQPGVDSCTPLPNGSVRCSYVKSVSEAITIDLSKATLPIMGNTENVPNSQSPTGSPPPLTDAEKVNGYVSWYLNGVTNRAEDGSSKNSDYNIVNLSGPLNKLLPSAIQDAQRIQSIDNVAAGQNHDQIVACADPNNTGLFAGLFDLLGLGKYAAKPCYAGNNTKATGNKVLTLSSWSDSFGFNIVANTFVKAWLTGLKLIYPSLADAIEASVGNHWTHAKPPLPWDDGTGNVFKTESEYEKAYQEWRGNVCAIIPVFNKVVCLNNIFVPSYYADLYPFIPLSSTEDVRGSVQVDSVSVGGAGITNVTFSNQTPSTLFFPHLVESDQLSSLLQDTYVASGEAQTGPDTAVAPTSSCTNIDVRSGTGDNLFATPLTGNLAYTASFTCDFTPSTCSGSALPPANRFCETEYSSSCVPSSWTCAGTAPNSGCPVGYKCGYACACNNSSQTCSKIVNVALSTSTSVPKIDDIWSRLVAGPTAIVKRFFPQLGTQIGTLKDLPGSTDITYSGAQASSGQLNLPHIGGISEYFLNGIQTLLRPKGYGQPISFGKIALNPSENIDCDESAPDVTLPNTIGKQALHDLAVRLEGGITGDHVLECYNDVARKSLAAGISPAFTFLMWINESGGSNYNISNQDWGINNSQVVGLNAQLARFLQLPAVYKSTYSECFGKTRTDTETFFDLFAVGLQGGQCVPEAGQPYIDLFNSLWSAYTTCPFTGYPFSSSCY